MQRTECNLTLMALVGDEEQEEDEEDEAAGDSDGDDGAERKAALKRG